MTNPRRAGRKKIYHMAAKINDAGYVSALCFSTPRRIYLSKALWSIRWVAVTCPRCLKLRDKEAG